MCCACLFVLTVSRQRRVFISDCEELTLRLSRDCPWHIICKKKKQLDVSKFEMRDRDRDTDRDINTDIA